MCAIRFLQARPDDFAVLFAHLFGCNWLIIICNHHNTYCSSSGCHNKLVGCRHYCCCWCCLALVVVFIILGVVSFRQEMFSITIMDVFVCMNIFFNSIMHSFWSSLHRSFAFPDVLACAMWRPCAGARALICVICESTKRKVLRSMVWAHLQWTFINKCSNEPKQHPATGENETKQTQKARSLCIDITCVRAILCAVVSKEYRSLVCALSSSVVHFKIRV